MAMKEGSGQSKREALAPPPRRDKPFG